MTKEQAIHILEQAINAGNLKGVYSLADITAIIQALVVIKED
jgi:hypothetical protein